MHGKSDFSLGCWFLGVVGPVRKVIERNHCGKFMESSNGMNCFRTQTCHCGWVDSPATQFWLRSRFRFRWNLMRHAKTSDRVVFPTGDSRSGNFINKTLKLFIAHKKTGRRRRKARRGRRNTRVKLHIFNLLHNSACRRALKDSRNCKSYRAALALPIHGAQTGPEKEFLRRK